MSQITLLNENEARYLESQLPYYQKDYNNKEYKPIQEPLESEDLPSDHQDFEENRVYYDPPVIHLLKIGDTMHSICRKYNVSVRVC
jgi:hypothetical protein